MKTKKLILFCALALSLTLLSGCAGNNKVDFENYWDVSSLYSNSIDETLVYDVNFNEGLSSQSYGISYANGTYTATLTYEDGDDYYVYTTNFSIDVTYTLNGENTEAMKDSVETRVIFATEKAGLRPIYSYKKFISHSPSNPNSAPTSPEKCYKLYEYEITTEYTDDGNTCTVVKNGNEETKQTKKFKTSGDHRYLDNAQLLFAPRGIDDDVTSGKFLSYSPFVDRVQTVNFAFGSETSGEFTFSKGEAEPTKQTIYYRPYQMQLDGNNSGSAQTAWYASLTDASRNENRNVMLYLETPIAYNLGSLVYTLKSATYR